MSNRIAGGLQQKMNNEKEMKNGWKKDGETDVERTSTWK